MTSNIPQQQPLVNILLYIFTLFHSFSRVIQSSHPVCNTIMLFGVITCLVSVVLLGIDGRFVNPDTYPKVSVMIQLYLRHHIIYHNTHTCVLLYLFIKRKSLRKMNLCRKRIHNESQHDLFFEKKCSSNSWGLYFAIFSTLTSFNVLHIMSSIYLI